VSPVKYELGFYIPDDIVTSVKASTLTVIKYLKLFENNITHEEVVH
jgi:hypothetical protein